MSRLLCRIFGHRWISGDLSRDGEASADACTRCGFVQWYLDDEEEEGE